MILNPLFAKYLRKTILFSVSFFNAAFGIFLISLLLGSCKESDTLGRNLIPNSDKSQFKSSSKFNLLTFAFREDSVKSDEVSINLLGSYVDPVFGKSSSSFITQFVSSSNQLDFGPNPIADSMVLSLTYSGYYGKIDKLNGLQKVKIYKLSNIIYKDSAYYSTTNPERFATENDLLTQQTFLPDPNGKYQSGTPIQKFHLPQSLGQSILAQQNAINSYGLASVFGGLFLKTANDFQTIGNGAILSFNLINADKPSKITLYFHNDTSTVVQKYDMLITSDCARINFFKHERNGAPELNNQFADTTLGKNNIYVQAMAGVSSKLWFTGLEAWQDSLPVIITKAELVLPVETSLIGQYAVPSRLLLVEKSTNGDYTSIADFGLSENYYNGFFNAADNTYRFNLAVYLQDMLNKSRANKGLYLVPAASAIGANRVILKGSDKIKLNVTYTKIK